MDRFSPKTDLSRYEIHREILHKYIQLQKRSSSVSNANSSFIYEREFHKFRASGVRAVIIIRTQEESSMQHNAYIFPRSCHSMQQTLYIVTRENVCVCVCIYAGMCLFRNLRCYRLVERKVLLSSSSQTTWGRERGKEGEISGPFVLSYNGPLATPLPYPPKKQYNVIY